MTLLCMRKLMVKTFLYKIMGEQELAIYIVSLACSDAGIFSFTQTESRIATICTTHAVSIKIKTLYLFFLMACKGIKHKEVRPVLAGDREDL